LPSPIHIRSSRLLSDAWAKLKHVTLDYTRRDGTVETLVRDVYDFGNGCVLLPYDPDRGTVLLVRQFRLPPFLAGEDPFLIEACAGLVDSDDPETAVRREAREELGLEIHEVRRLFDAWSTPGAVAEKMSFFTARYSPADRISAGGGEAHEGEDIEVLELPFADALAMIRTGEIRDVKTIALLLWTEAEKRPA
jgi:nudix-type nucleoside diphosphatase (YffH/AdpP family)